MQAQELDQQRARGQQGAKSPLLWEAREVEQYLAGSPVQADIRARLQVRAARHGGDPCAYQASGVSADLLTSARLRVGSS